MVEGHRYDHDVVIDGGRVTKRDKGPSRSGAEAPVLRAYHTLRAVPVPAGESTVVMEYHSALLARSAWISLLVLLGLSATGVAGLVLGRRGAGAGEGTGDAGVHADAGPEAAEGER